MAQTSYGYTTEIGNPGGLYDIAPYEAVTRISEAENGAIGFGYGVVTGESAGTTVAAPSATDDTFEGVVMWKALEENRAGEVIVLNGDSFAVLVFGNIFVRVPDDLEVEIGDDAYVIVSGDDAGKFTNDSTGLATGGKFIGLADNGVAPVRLPND